MTSWLQRYSRRADLFAIWLAYLGGTLIWVLLVVAGRDLSPLWWLFIANAAVLNLAAVARGILFPRDRQAQERR